MSESAIKVCIDKVLPFESVVAASERSVKENPLNAPMVSFRAHTTPPPLEPVAMALLTQRKWKAGRTLRISFLNGEQTVRDKIERIAKGWEKFANLKLQFGSDRDAEIRIGIKWNQDPGSWSWLGTEALSITDLDEPTMNYGWLTPNSPEEEYSRVVLHEFGHAFGCIHEHQHPKNGIPWDREAVYRYYMGPPNNWTKRQIDHNLFAAYSTDITNYSKFDKSSIMLYAIPNELTTGNYEIRWNRTLSPTDTSFIQTQYPFDKKEIIEIVVGSAPAKAEIGQHGEEDVFQFQVEEKGKYVIETHGDTDVVMGVFGPNDQTKLVDQDDDSGKGRNAKIVGELQPGTYHLRVHHYRPKATGSYEVSVRKQV
jgi:hypothetical protein